MPSAINDLRLVYLLCVSAILDVPIYSFSRSLPFSPLLTSSDILDLINQGRVDNALVLYTCSPSSPFLYDLGPGARQIPHQFAFLLPLHATVQMQSAFGYPRAPTPGPVSVCNYVCFWVCAHMGRCDAWSSGSAD